MYGLTNYTKRFNEILPEDVVCNMDQRDFVDYCREQLWDKIALEKHGKEFASLTWAEKGTVDLLALVRLANTFNDIQRENLDQQN